MFAAAGVFLNAGLKVPYFAFFSRDRGIRCDEAPKNMLVAMAIASAFYWNWPLPNGSLLAGALCHRL